MNHYRRRLIRSMQALATLGMTNLPFINASAATSQDFNFVLIGDTPYSPLDEYSLIKVLTQASAGAAFFIHVGDIKSGTEVCSDELLKHRLNLLKASPIPLVFIPGDNEWVDCSRPAAGHYKPAERLDFLRAQAFGGDVSLGKKTMPLRSQPMFPEHKQWQHGNIHFVTLNIPGSYNGIDDLSKAEIDTRMQAVHAWMNDAFKLAANPSIGGLVVAIHANIGVNSSGFQALKSKRFEAYGEFRGLFLAACKSFAKPVLLLHGDSHNFATDKPSELIPNLTRVECFGYPFTSAWARISVVHQNPALFVVTANHL
jgi:Calcineurin-like phosphoesterase